MLLVTAVLALLITLVQADSTGTVATAPWYAVGLVGLWQIVAPVLASAIFKKWQSVQASLHGIGKQIAYSAFATLWLLVPQGIGMLLDKNPDNWMQAGFVDLLTAVGASLLYKLGTKPDAPPVATP